MFFKKKLLSRAEMRDVVAYDISDNIRKYRDEKCFTQSYMSNELGIGQSAYQKIESGDSKVSIERLKQIAEILGKPMGAFLDKEQDSRSLAEKESPITFTENVLLQKIILQQEKRIEELEEKVKRKDNKIEELKLALNLKEIHSN